MTRKKTKWNRVSRSDKCPVCGKPDWCSVSDDGEVAYCMRIESPTKKGSGYIHYLTEQYEFQRQPERREEPASDIDWTQKARDMFNHQHAARKREETAEAISVPLWTMEDLLVGIGWDQHNGHEFASFPCYSAAGKVLGITRRYPNGSKRTMKGGSNTGLFLKPYWWRIPGPVFIVEGASDVAACIGASLCAIGRPSNLGGVEYISTLLKRRAKGREVIVVGERDIKLVDDDKCADGALCEGCQWCFPGKYGAMVTSSRLKEHGAKWMIPPSPYKDMRDMIVNGGKIELKAVQH